jgi:hypothetical protein
MRPKRASGIDILERIRRRIGLHWTPEPTDSASASVALAVAIALLRALRDRGVLSQGEINDVFDEVAGRFPRDTAFGLINSVRADVERKDEE